MSDSYLQLAEKIIRARAKPLSAKLILTEAKRFGLLPAHLAGSTMHKTLQARISDDINSQHENSIFYRVGVGTYFLREFAKDPTLPDVLTKEIPPPGRVKSIKGSRILHSEVPACGENETIVNASLAISWIQERNYFNYAHSIKESELLIGTFTIIKMNGHFFIHSIGKFSHFYNDNAHDVTTIGLRRYIDEFDDDIFAAVDFGIDFSSAREVIRNLAVAGGMDFIDDRQLRKSMKLHGAIVDKNIRSLFFIVSIDLDEPKNGEILFRARKDVRNPHWSKMASIDTSNLDQLSKLILSSDFVR